MQSFNIEEKKVQHIASNMGKVPSATYESRVMLVIVAAALPFISIGYHISIFNSISIYLWELSTFEDALMVFINLGDLVMEIVVCAVAFFVTFQYVKLNEYRFVFYIAEILMIIGTIVGMGLVSLDTFTMFFGRAIVGISVGINITTVLPYLREVQQSLSESKFKVEKRRFCTEVFFALGVFLGMIPTKIFSSLTPFEEYDLDEDKPANTPEPNYSVLRILAGLPIILSIARIILFVLIGKIELPAYAPAFTDDGLRDMDEIHSEERLSILKFRDVKVLRKLLDEPYRRRIDTAYVLYFLQVSTGFVIGIVNPYYIAYFFKIETEDENTDVQYNVIRMGLEYIFVIVLSALALSLCKIPRKVLMLIGATGAAAIAMVLTILTFMMQLEVTRFFLTIYWIFINLGFGVVLEVYGEEILPAKGLQILISLKWVMIIVIGIITRYWLTVPLFYGFLYLYLFMITMGGIFVIYVLLPETNKANPDDIVGLFNTIAEEELAEELEPPQFSQIGQSENAPDINTQLE